MGEILNFINQNESSIQTTNLETSPLSTPFLRDIAKTDDFFLKYITDTNTDTLPNHSPLIASIPSKHGGVGYRNPSRAGALGAFAIPIARTIDYAIRGIKLGDSRATIHKYPLKKLIESTSRNPWKMIRESPESSLPFRFFQLFLLMKPTTTTKQTYSPNFQVPKPNDTCIAPLHRKR
jgi:hypothetical protein